MRWARSKRRAIVKTKTFAVFAKFKAPLKCFFGIPNLQHLCLKSWKVSLFGLFHEEHSLLEDTPWARSILLNKNITGCRVSARRKGATLLGDFICIITGCSDWFYWL
jgi:hypothetical protein